MIVAGVLVQPSSTALAPTAEAQKNETYQVAMFQGEYNHPQPLPNMKVLCNCYAYVKSKYPTLPPVGEIKSNLSAEPGNVVVFDYDGLDHFAIVESVGTSTLTLSETNFNKCKKGTRTIPLSDKSLLGFFHVAE